MTPLGRSGEGVQHVPGRAQVRQLMAGVDQIGPSPPQDHVMISKTSFGVEDRRWTVDHFLTSFKSHCTTKRRRDERTTRSQSDFSLCSKTSVHQLTDGASAPVRPEPDRLQSAEDAAVWKEPPGPAMLWTPSQRRRAFERTTLRTLFEDDPLQFQLVKA